MPAAKIKTQKSKGRRLFTVSEDHQILVAWRKMKETTPVSRIAEKLAKQLKRCKDSVRDRIRRYIARLNESEIETMEKMYKV